MTYSNGMIPRWLGAHAEQVLAARGDPERLASVFEQSPIPTVMVDDQRAYIEANQAALDAFGLTLTDIRRMRIDDVTPPYLLPEFEAAWNRLLDTGVVLGRQPSGPKRTYVALSYFSVANVLPGRHVFAFAPPSESSAEAPPGLAGFGEEVRLTPRELEILELAADGLNGPRIAHALVLSPATVRTHFGHIYRKLNVGDRAAAVARAMRLGLIK